MRFFLSFFLLNFLFGMVQANSISAEQTKIGYVDLIRVFDEYNKTKEFNKELGEKGRVKQKQIDKTIDEIKALQKQWDALTGGEKEVKGKEIEKKKQELQDLKRQAWVDINRERDMLRRDILKEIIQTIKEYGDEGNFALIFNEATLLYGEGGIDLTHKIIEILNTKYKKRKK